MKQICRILSLVLPVLLLSGCWDRTELNDIAIVTAVAIDKKDSQHIELSIQVFIPRALSGGGGMGGGGAGGGPVLTLVRSGNGVNLSDAMSKLQSKIPRRIFWGHSKVFIFGEEMAKGGISDEMDFLLRHPEPRERAYMFVSKGKAVDMIELTPPLERYSGEVIRELSDLHIGMSVTMKDLHEMLRGETGAAAIPLLAILPPKKREEELQTIPYIVGTALFKKDKMIGQITERTTRGVMWLRDDIQVTTVTVKDEKVKGFVSLNPIRSSTKLIPKIEDGKWKMLVKVKTEGDLIENGTNLNLMNPQLLGVMQKALEEDIRTRMEMALKQVQKEMKLDVFGFAKEFHRKYPKQWNKVKNHWEDVFPQVEVTMDIQAYIRRPGLITVPAGIPEKEVKEK